ncbi:amino acid kinase family protein [Phyllobacterium chamaecytisi]|uniref:amino acid kinase family protein n=1 Tax=Phyllobacterium chamaecytisi TaxID=2876082 RepID=UPI001CCF9438|nr:dihydroneopterin aldolase [Phyllobacterium sp. KW56]MBZ9601293.1 dihydroneopterin aldolase [Phyllobacterium sp. KW56]
MKPLVVKLGGSTAGHAEMQRWIDLLASANFPLVIVPGGGPFADQVRTSQKRLGYSDDAAHAMAILAMDQFGIAIAERHPQLRVARSISQIGEVLDAGATPVWLPSSMTLDAVDIPCSWQITSDSLSAWLARQLSADTLLLVKQTDEYTHYTTVRELAAVGIVDSMLPDMLGEGTSLHVAGPRMLDTHDLPLASIPGRRIMRHRQTEAMGAQ